MPRKRPPWKQESRIVLTGRSNYPALNSTTAITVMTAPQVSAQGITSAPARRDACCMKKPAPRAALTQGSDTMVNVYLYTPLALAIWHSFIGNSVQAAIYLGTVSIVGALISLSKRHHTTQEKP